MKHTITIPGFTPVRVNEWRGRHWSVRAKLNLGQQELIGHYGRDVPKATGQRRIALTVWGYPRGRKPDRDAFDKDMLDSLKRLGLITDDDERGLEGRMSVEIIRSKQRKTVIELEDVG